MTTSTSGDTLLTLSYQGQVLAQALVSGALWSGNSAALLARAQSYGDTLQASTVTASNPAPSGVQTFQTFAGVQAWVDQTAVQNGQIASSPQTGTTTTETSVVVTTPAKLPTAVLFGAGAGFVIGAYSAISAKESIGKGLLDTGIASVTGAAIGQLVAALMAQRSA